MTDRIQQAINAHYAQLGADISAWLAENQCRVQSGSDDNTAAFLEFIAGRGGLQLDRTSSLHRNRAKAIIPLYQRCQAYKANGDQCTRRRKEDADLCGTHIKGIPHGRIAADSTTAAPTCAKIVTYVQEVNGINYHVDARTKEVYRSEDILTGNRYPRVVGHLRTDSGYQIVAHAAPSVGA